ncbi:hypothetical protein FACS1894107_10220 [Planctomycetales bacterium]|nr:hypothetical protein FACS1894107_10220 [Planctomycetales bacterium]GHS99109.1 hypothetical protein FACS1894108_08470 [Planctomycetales bacterium]
MNLSVSEFAEAIKDTGAYDFYRKNVQSFDRKLTPSADPFYAVKTRTFVVPLDAAFLLDYVDKTNGAYPFPGLFDGEAALAKNIVPLYTDVFVGRNAKTLEIPVVTYPPSYILPDRYMVTVGYEYTETKAGGGSTTVDWTNVAAYRNGVDASGSAQVEIYWQNGVAPTKVFIDVTAGGYYPNPPAGNVLYNAIPKPVTQNITLVRGTWDVDADAGKIFSPAAYYEAVKLLRNAVRDTIVNNGFYRNAANIPANTPINFSNVNFYVPNQILTSPPEGGSFTDNKTHHYPEFVRYATDEQCWTFSTDDDIYYARTADIFANALSRDGVPVLALYQNYQYNGGVDRGNGTLTNARGSVVDVWKYDEAEERYYLHSNNGTGAQLYDTTLIYIKLNGAKTKYELFANGNKVESYDSATGIIPYLTAQSAEKSIYVDGKKVTATYGYGDWVWGGESQMIGMADIGLFFGSGSDYNLVRGVIKKADGTTATFGPFAADASAINGATDKLSRISQMLDTLDNRDYYLGKAGYWNDANTLKFNSAFYTVDSSIGSILSPSQLSGGAGVTGLLGSGDTGNPAAVRAAPFYAASELDGVIDWDSSYSYWYDHGGESLLTGAPLTYANQTAKLNAAANPTLNVSFPPALGGAKAVLGGVTLNVAQNSTVPGETIQPDPITEMIEVQLGGSEAQLDDYVTLKAGLPEDDGYFSAAVNYIAMNERNGTPSANIAYNIVNKIKNVANFYFNDSLTGVSGELAIANSYINHDAQTAIQAAANDSNNRGGKNLLGTEFAPYAPMADLIHLAKQTTDLYTLNKIDAARILANPPRQSGGENYVADFKKESLIVGMNEKPNTDTLAHKYANYKDGKIKAELIYRDGYSSFNELGINVLGLREANGQPVDTVLTSSLGFNTKSFADAKLFQSKCDADAANATDCGNPAAADNQGDRRYPLKYIPLNTATPKWLIAAAVGWQLFNSPTAKLRRSSLLANTDEGGAIYRIDYASATGGTYVFDQRLLYGKNSNGDDLTIQPELIITPYGYTAPGVSVAAGSGNYIGFPLKYRGDIACPSNDNVNAVEWKGWDGTTSLDLLAFAPHTSNSYTANGATPFKKDTGDVLPANNFDDFVDVRTNTFAGTGTYVRPAFPGGNYEVINPSDPNKSILSSDERYNGRLAIYGNSLRVHGELARIVEIIDLLKDGELHADKFEDYGGAVGDTIGNIVKAIYHDRQVGYEIGAPTSRSVLARNPFEGTVIWARNPNGVSAGLNAATDYKAVFWTTGGTTPPTWGVVPNSGTGGMNPTQSGELPPLFAMLTGGSGFTADRYTETFMESNIGSYSVNSQSGGKRYADGGRYTNGGDWASLVVDNTAVDWDGAPLNLIFGANFGFYNTIPYNKESAFQNAYFQQGKPYGQASPYNNGDISGGGAAGGSNVQGYDGTSSGGGFTGYAEPVWYSTGDAMAPPANSELQFGDNYRSGPVIYCDGPGDVTGNVTSGTYNKLGNNKVRTLTAPPYQIGTGRWDKRTNTSNDAPGYTPAYEYGSASYSDADKKDPSKNGTLYRNDTTKRISQWRWNWGKWEEIPEAPTKGTLYTFVKDDSFPGWRKVLTPDCDDSVNSCVNKHDAIAGSSDWFWGEKAYRYKRQRIAGYEYPNGDVSQYPYKHGDVYRQEKYAWGTEYSDKYYRFGPNNFSDKPYKVTIDTTSTYGMWTQTVRTVIDSDNDTAPAGSTKVSSTGGTAGTLGQAGTRETELLGEFYAPAADAGANIIGAGSLAMLPDNRTYVDRDGNVTTNKNSAYVGRFVMRRATVHRWRPAIGSVYPMYLEINPQAIKNAAIERVVVNLFGAEVYPQGAAHTDANNLIRTDYLLPHNLVAKKAELQRTHDDATPVFSPEPTDKYFRVIVAAALVNEPKQAVVAQRFLQYIYRVAANGRAAVVDQHFFEPE